MNNLKISILLISYNNFKYIFNALNSIFKQNYDNIQLIVSDDASADFDEEKIWNYINKFKHKNISDIIVNINKENLGTVKHLEKLYEMCTGDLITVIAADDAYADNRAISSLMNEYLLYNGEVQVITSLLAMCDSGLRKRNYIFTPRKDVELINSGSKRELLDELAYRCVMPSSGTIVHKDVYKAIGKLSDIYNYVEDWTSHIRMVRLGIKIKCINRITVLHRDGGISHGNTRANNDAHFLYCQDILNIYTFEVLPHKEQFSGYAVKRAEQFYNWRLAGQTLDSFNKNNKGQKIVFYCRKGMIAQGDFSLYYRVGEWLAKEPDINVYCVNNSNENLKKNFLDTDIFFGDLNNDNLHNFDDAIFVTSYNQLFFLLDDIKNLSNARILLLFTHPMVSVWMKNQAFFKSFDLKSINEMLARNNAYAMMDGSNYYQVQEIYPNIFSPKFFPVIKEECMTAKSNGKIIDPECINMAWLGRLDGDKIQSLLYFLDNAFDSIESLKMNVHLIGNGNSKNIIDINKYAGKIRFIFNSSLYGKQRDNYLVQNVDFVVAMGISAIDVAKLAIPTIIPIISSAKIREDKFVYIYDVKQYSLGWDSVILQKLGCKTHKASNIISAVFYENLKRELGIKCCDFVNSEFSISKHLNNDKKLIMSTTLTVKQCLENQTVKKQFSVFGLYKKFLNKNGTYADFIDFKRKLKSLMRMNLLKKSDFVLKWFIKKLTGRKNDK